MTSEAAFKRDIRSVDVMDDDERLEIDFTPMMNEGPRKGYAHLLDERVLCTRDSSDLEMGRC